MKKLSFHLTRKMYATLAAIFIVSGATLISALPNVASADTYQLNASIPNTVTGLKGPQGAVAWTFTPSVTQTFQSITLYPTAANPLYSDCSGKSITLYGYTPGQNYLQITGNTSYGTFYVPSGHPAVDSNGACVLTGSGVSVPSGTLVLGLISANSDAEYGFYGANITTSNTGDIERSTPFTDTITFGAFSYDNIAFIASTSTTPNTTPIAPATTTHTYIKSFQPVTSSVATTSPTTVSLTAFLNMDDYAFHPPEATTTSPFVTIILHNYDVSRDYIIGYRPVSATGDFTFATTTALAEGAYSAIFGLNTPGMIVRQTSSFVVGSTTLPQRAINAIWDQSASTTIYQKFGDCDTGITSLAGWRCILSSAFSDTATWLLVPSNDSVNSFFTINDTMKTKTPFVYLYQVAQLRSDLLNSAGSSTMQLDVPLGHFPGASASSTFNIISPAKLNAFPYTPLVKQILGWVLWLLLIETLWLIGRNLFASDHTKQ